MKQVLQHVGSGKLELGEVPAPYCKAGSILVQNRASLISAGTEKMVIEFAGKSMLGKARERPDLVRQVVDKVTREGVVSTARTVLGRLSQPIPLGYSCAGVVDQVGTSAEEFAVGDRVACAGMGYASHAGMVCVPKNLTVRIPDGVSFEDAAYVTLGAIALQGVRVAGVRLGETVAVIGLGLLGQLTVQLLAAAGCRVIGIDLDAARTALARQLGAEAAASRADDVAGAVRAFTGGVGVDAVIITAATESNDPVELAGELCRDRGVVAVVGAVKMDVPRKVYYEKELEVRLSRSYGPGRYDPAYEEGGHDYPIGYVRWTERRNMEEFLRLVAAGAVTPSRLTTHRYPIEQAEAAYGVIRGADAQPFLGIVLQYGEAETPLARTLALRPGKPVAARLGLGFIGAGNFAKGTLLPRFRKADTTLIGVATANGASARATGQKFGFAWCTTDPHRILEDPGVHAVVVATPHGSHARYAADALRAGKAVFVEKPLAIDAAGLEEVLQAQAETGGLLMVGYNRRFSPFAAEMKRFFPSGAPLAIQYRINAGAIPPNSWIHDRAEGGGRIIGEVCHFIDFAQYLTGDRVREVHAIALGAAHAPMQDTVCITLRYVGGGIASINYYATGDRSYPKEQVEVCGAGGIAVLDDFRGLILSRAGRRRRVRRFSQVKGFDEEVSAFVAAACNAGEPPIPITSLAETTQVTFAIEESLRSGLPVSLIS